MDEDSRMIIEYLRALPEGSVVRWSSHHVSRAEPWTTHWVDIRIDDDGAPPMNWVWTIIGDDDPDGTGPDQLWQFVVPYDIDVHRVGDRAGGTFNVWLAPYGESPPACIAAAYEPLAARIDGWYEVRGGWTVGAIGQALAGWAARHAGRTDLRLEWNPEGEPYPAVRQAIERARAIEEGAPVQDLGDGLVLADGVMDDLLALDPEERAKVLDAMREAHRRTFGEPEDDPADD